MNSKQLSLVNLIQCTVKEDEIQTHLNYVIQQIARKLNTQICSDVILLENLYDLLKIKIEMFPNEELLPQDKVDSLVNLLLTLAENNTIDSSKICEIIEIFICDLKYSDILLNLTKIVKNQFKLHLNKNQHDDCVQNVDYNNLEFYLKLFLIILEIIGNRNNTSDIITEFDNEEFYQILIHMTCFGNDFLALENVVYIIPKILILSKNNKFLKDLWQTMLSIYFENSFDKIHRINRILLLLCMLKEYFLPKNPGGFQNILLNDEEFWKLLQENLLSTNFQIRKQALFILKRAILVSTDCNINVAYSNIKENSSWQNYFILLETLEERQLHIITPTLNYVKEIYNNFHISWSVILFIKILTHENSKVNLWAIHNLNIFDFSNNQQYTLYYKKLISTLLPIVNNSLYLTQKTRDDFIDSLISYFENILKTNFAQEYFKYIIKIMVEIKWGPISFFYISYILSQISSSEIYDSETIILIKNFLETNLNAQNNYLRCSTESCFLKQVLNLSVKNIPLQILCDFFSVLRKDTLNKKMPEIIQFLKLNYTEEIVCEYIVMNISYLGKNHYNYTKKLARMIVLLLHLDIIRQEKYQTIILTFSKLIDQFIGIHKRPYANDSSTDILEFIKYFFKESNCITNTSLLLQIKEIFYSVYEELLNSIMSKIKTYTQIIDIDKTIKYFSTIETLLQTKPLNNMTINFLMNSQKSILNSNNNFGQLPLEKYSCIKFLVIIRKTINYQNEILKNVERDHSLIIKKFEEQINSTLKDNDIINNATKDFHRNFALINSEYLENKWFLYSEYIQSNNNLIYSEETLLDYINEGLDITNKYSLINIMNVIEIILKSKSKFYTKNCLLENIVDKCFNLTNDLKNSNAFMKTITKFCSMIFHSKTILESSINCDRYGVELFKQAETIPQVAHIFIKIFYNTCIYGNTNVIIKNMKNTFIDALTYGELLQKDKKLLQDLYDFIDNQKEIIFWDDSFENLKDYDIRLKAINILHLLNKETINLILQLLLDKDKNRTRSKTKYFLNSYLHRTKLRTLQVLLICNNFINMEEAKNIFVYILNSLKTISHPTNTKFYYQWIIALLAIRYKEIRGNIWDVCSQIPENNHNHLQIWIIIIYFIHLGIEEMDFTKQSLDYVLPLLMAQNFTTRLYAQIVFENLFQFCLSKKNNELIIKYEAIYTNINLNGFIPSKKDYKEENLYNLLKMFHPHFSYNLKTIFHYLPKLTQVQDDEFIPLSKIKLINCIISKENENDLIYHIEDKNNSSEIYSHSSSYMPLNIDSTNVQKKMMPFQELMLEESKKKIFSSNLIVCASLVERMPNLGGLARTCEIMGISKFILNNKNSIINKEFTSLSVTAEKWLNIQEVRINELAEYMLNMKKEGYTLIGAEQTAKSISLCNVKFPDKTLLLLGNEKTGISPDLLPLLEYCVEIPQYGQLRSLNVHVSGALIIWEYKKQQLKI